MSSAKARFRVSSVIAWPPYFTTIVLPWYVLSHGSASARVAALAVARSQASRLSVAAPPLGDAWLLDVMSPPPPSARVRRVLVHVGVREVVGPDRGLRVAGLEVDGDVDLARREVDERRVLVGSR